MVVEPREGREAIFRETGCIVAADKAIGVRVISPNYGLAVSVNVIVNGSPQISIDQTVL